MKFPTKKSPKNLNIKGNSATIQKDHKKASSKPSNGLNSSSSSNKNTKKSFPSSGASHKGNKNNSTIHE
jgi:hypothetical protein